MLSTILTLDNKELAAILIMKIHNEDNRFALITEDGAKKALFDIHYMLYREVEDFDGYLPAICSTQRVLRKILKLEVSEAAPTYPVSKDARIGLLTIPKDMVTEATVCGDIDYHCHRIMMLGFGDDMIVHMNSGNVFGVEIINYPYNIVFAPLSASQAKAMNNKPIIRLDVIANDASILPVLPLVINSALAFKIDRFVTAKKITGVSTENEVLSN